MRQVMIIGLAVFFVLVAASVAMAEENTHQPCGTALIAVIAIIAITAVLVIIVIWAIRRPSCISYISPRISSLKPRGLTGVTNFFVEGYQILVEVRDGIYISPFKTKSGSEIRRTNREDLLKSLKGCLEKEEFAAQKEELIRRGIIKEDRR